MITEPTGVTGPSTIFTVQDFAAQIRQKSPGTYDNMSDEEVARSIEEQYPQYQGQIDYGVSDPLKKKDETALGGTPQLSPPPSVEAATSLDSPSTLDPGSIEQDVPGLNYEGPNYEARRRDAAQSAHQILVDSPFDSRKFNQADVIAESVQDVNAYEQALKSPEAFYSLAEIAGVDVISRSQKLFNWNEEQGQQVNDIMQQVVFGNTPAFEGFSAIGDLAMQSPDILQQMNISMFHEGSAENNAKNYKGMLYWRDNEGRPVDGAPEIPVESMMFPNKQMKSRADLKYEVSQYMEKTLYDSLAEQYLKMLPTEYQTDDAYIEGLEQYFLEEYGTMLDMDKDGIVGNVPFARWEGWQMYGGDGRNGTGGFQFPVPKWTGYVADMLEAGEMDLLSAWAMLSNEPQLAKDYAKRAEETRGTTRQYEQGITEAEFQQKAEQAMGGFLEAAPTMSLLVPSGVALGMTGIGPTWIVALTALEGATLHTATTAARYVDSPFFQTYTNPQTEEVLDYEGYMQFEQENPNSKVEWAKETNPNAKNGFLSKVFLTNFVVDGVTSLAFVRGLRSIAPNNVTGAGMQWWKHHLIASGISVPQGATISGVVAMQQYADEQELAGRTATWAELREVGVEAAVRGGVLAGGMSSAGVMTGIALSRDSYGRGGRNLKFHQTEMILRKELLREDVSTAYKQRMEQQLRDLYNTPSTSRLLQDEEFYANMNPEDIEALRVISLEQTDLLRKLRVSTEDESEVLKVKFEELTVQRNKLEMFYERGENEVPLKPLQDGIPERDGSLYFVPRENDQKLVPLYPLTTRPYARWYEEAKSSSASLDRLVLDRWSQEPEAKRGLRPPLNKGMDPEVLYKLLGTQTEDYLKRYQDARVGKGGMYDQILEWGKGLTEAEFDLLPKDFPRTTDGFLSYLLQAVHASERNDFIYNKAETQKRRQTLMSKKQLRQDEQDELDRINSRSGSGFTDEAAGQFIKALPDELLTSFEKLNKVLRKDFDSNWDIMYESGFLSQQAYVDGKARFKNYIQLYGSEIDADGVPVSTGAYPNVPKEFAERYPYRESMGREGQITDVIGRMVQQHERNYILAAKNKVMQSYWDFFNEYPDSSYRTFTKESYEKHIQYGSKDDPVGPLRDVKGNLAPNVLLSFKDGQEHYIMFLDKEVSKTNRDRYQMYRDARSRRRGNQPMFDRVERARDEDMVTIRGHRFVDAITNASPRETKALLGMGKSFFQFTSKFRKTFTSYNPLFVTYAPVRDIVFGYHNAYVNTQKEFGWGLTDAKGNQLKSSTVLAEVTKKIPMAMYAVGRDEFNTTGLLRGVKDPNLSRKHHKYWNEAKQDGLVTGYGHLDDMLKIQQQIERETDPAKRYDKARSAFDRVNFFKMIEAMNNTAENGVRFASYMALRDQGVSREYATAFGRDFSVDFNRKGSMTDQLGQWYWFFNPSAEGLDNFSRMVTSKKPELDMDGQPIKNRRQIMQKMTAAGVAFGAFLTEWNMLFGDVDETGIPYYDQLDHSTLQRNFVIMLPGTDGDMLKLPKPYAVGFFTDMGRELVETMNGRQSMMEAGGDIVTGLKHNFSPWMITDHSYVEDAAREPSANFAKEMADVVLPSALQPVVDVMTNEMYNGMPIEPEYLSKMSNAERSRMAPKPVKEFFQMMNLNTGGDDYRSGGVDINPDYLWYPIQSYMGGVYMTFNSVGNWYSTKQTIASGQGALQAELDSVNKQVGAEEFYQHIHTGEYVKESDIPANDKSFYVNQEQEVRQGADMIRQIVETPSRLLSANNTPVVRYYYEEAPNNQIAQRYYETLERLAPQRDQLTDFLDWDKYENMTEPERDAVDGRVFGDDASVFDRNEAYLMAGLVQQQLNQVMGGGELSLKRDLSGMNRVGMGTQRAAIKRKINELDYTWNSPDSTRNEYYKLNQELAAHDSRTETLMILFLRYADQYLKPDP